MDYMYIDLCFHVPDSLETFVTMHLLLPHPDNACWINDKIKALLRHYLIDDIGAKNEVELLIGC